MQLTLDRDAKTMPFTPFHFGPAACLSLPLKRRMDVPVFILANVVIDIEPLAVMAFGLDYPLHCYAHTLVFGGLLGAAFGVAVFPSRTYLSRLMEMVSLPYLPSLSGMALSGASGAWFHILLDSPLYADMRPLYPFAHNPAYGLVGGSAVYAFCAASFIPAVAAYLLSRGGAEGR